MHPLSPHLILQIWEIGQNQHPLARALILLPFACPGKTADELASFTIGQRDAYLLTLREVTFGSKLNSFAECPHCQERLEFTLNVADIRIEPMVAVKPEYTLTVGEFELRFRLPNSRDLAAIVGYQQVSAASALLGKRCLLEAMQDGVPISWDELPPHAIAQLSKKMGECDPQAEIFLDLNCPSCSHSWPVLFDIVSFFWSELSAQAKRLLHEVHLLARFYGWREADILSMSAVRRQFYLDLAS